MKFKKIIENMKFEVEDFIDDKIISPIHNTKQGIKNLIKWIPVIWKDRDWDEYYFFEVIRFKLEQMEELQRCYGNSVNSEQYANEIKLAKLLSERICKGGYLDNALFWYEKEYSDDDLITFEDIEGSTSKRIKFTENKRQRSMFSKAGEHSDKMEKQDIDYLFEYLNKHIQKWWD